MSRDVYVPPFECVLRGIGVHPSTFDSAASFLVPKEFLKLLFRMALENSEFDEKTYASENPDLANNSGKLEFPSIRDHFVERGYFERRRGGTPAVNERWYLSAYPDVAEALQSGRIDSARQHYNLIGFREGRSPNAKYLRDAILWKKAFAGH